MKVVTLAERKAAAVDKTWSALARLRPILAAHARLASHARARGGRFILYGSVARGDMRHDSDVDVIVDVPAEEIPAACEAVEEACSMLRLPLDLRTLDLCRPLFLERLLVDAEIIA